MSDLFEHAKECAAHIGDVDEFPPDGIQKPASPAQVAARAAEAQIYAILAFVEVAERIATALEVRNIAELGHLHGGSHNLRMIANDNPTGERMKQT